MSHGATGAEPVSNVITNQPGRRGGNCAVPLTRPSPASAIRPGKHPDRAYAATGRLRGHVALTAIVIAHVVAVVVAHRHLGGGQRLAMTAGPGRLVQMTAGIATAASRQRRAR